MQKGANSALGGLALRAAVHLAEGAEERTPVDTGRLRAGWSARETGPLSAEVRNEVPYASFVEFDTRHHISGNVVPGQRFFGRAMVETEMVLPGMAEERLREAVGRWVGD